jgi:hypothetical protein
VDAAPDASADDLVDRLGEPVEVPRLPGTGEWTSNSTLSVPKNSRNV